jgi:hypothetical protein
MLDGNRCDRILQFLKGEFLTGIHRIHGTTIAQTAYNFMQKS